MRRMLAPLVVLTMLLAGSSAWVSLAGAAPHSPARTTRAAGQVVGDTVTLFSTAGDEEGAFTVTDLTDDFQDTEEQPPRGERMVSLDVAIEANGGDISVDPASFNIVDSTGVLWIDIDVTRTDRKDSLEATDLADGDSVEGSLEIVIPTGVDIDKLIYIVDNERVLTLLDNTSGVEAGDSVDLFTTDGDETGTIVADEVFDDFQDVAAGSEPARGAAIYGIVVTLENTGADPLTVGPETFIAVDELGTAWAADTSIERTRASTREYPDLESGDVAEGDSVSGFVGFTVSADVAIDYVAYIPDARLYPVVDNAPSASGNDASPTADDNGPLGPTGKKTPTARKTPTSDGGDCAGVADWEDVAVENVTNWGSIFGDLDPNNLDANDLRDNADAISDIAQSQADSNPPDIAQDLNDILTKSYEDSAQALNDLADAVEQDDQAAIGRAAADIQAIGESFQSGDVDDLLQELRDACPDEVDQL